MQFDFATIVLIVGIVQALFLALVLVLPHGPRQRAHGWLALFLASFALSQCEDVLYDSRLLLRVPQLYGTLSLLLLAVAPSLYLYVRAVARPREALRASAGWHFLPVGLFVLLSIPEYLRPTPERLELVRAEYAKGSYYFNLSVLIPIVQVLVYLTLVGVELARHSRRIRDSYSSLAGVDLRWLLWLLGVNLGLWLLWIGCFAQRWQPGLAVLNTGYTLFVYSFGYFGWRQRGLFADEPAVPLAAEATKYAHSGLTQERSRALRQALDHLMDRERPYRDPLLTLPKLARRLGVSPNHLSQVLNEELQRSFFDFVNARRVDEVKARLTDPANSHLTVVALAQEAGFNSKSAFNTAFRRHTGSTPRAYRAQRSAAPAAPGSPAL